VTGVYHENSHSCAQVTLLLCPKFSLSAFSNITESLHLANEQLKQPAFQLTIASADGQPVSSNCNINIPCHSAALSSKPSDIMMILAGEAELINEELLQWIREQKNDNRLIVGIGAGSCILAQAGLYDHHRVTTHWRFDQSLRQASQRLKASRNLYEHDNHRISCAGGASTLDMILYMISQRLDNSISAAIADEMVYGQYRNADEQQKAPLKSRLGINQPKLLEAVELMEANVEEPLTSDDLARHVGVSRRHLERLFKRHLQSMPSQYYLEIRMEKARQLLRLTDYPILEVGQMCGFSSASYFSTAYRNYFDQTPREERRQNQPQGNTALSPSFGRSKNI